jgi:membrane-bound lytic murein transglycosylase B
MPCSRSRFRHTRRSTRRSTVALLLCLGSVLVMPTAHAADLSQRPDVQAFINQMVEQHGFNRSQLESDFNKIRLQPKIIAAMNRPAEAQPWYKYKNIFGQQKRITEGVKFWNKYRSTLKRAEETYQVEASIIVAIIGIETFYGKNKGSWRVIDAIATLGFDYPRRGEFFRKELKEYLILAREERFDPFSLKGSYAGAMGWGQFIPSSYRAYAVDFDGDGRRDLLSNPVDAIGSVANYFKAHGWQYGQPVVLPVTVSGADKQREGLPDGNDIPTVRLQALGDYGIALKGKVDGDPVSNFIKLETARGKYGYWVGLQNFYTITRYNRSPLYAMSAYDLSRAVLKKKG